MEKQSEPVVKFNGVPQQNKDVSSLDVLTMDNDALASILRDLPLDKKLVLFPRVVERIKSKSYNEKENNALILTLPPQERLKYIHYYTFYRPLLSSLNPVELREFVEGIEDEEALLIVAKEGLDQGLDVIHLLTVLPNSKKVDFLKLVSNKERELKEDLIGSTNIEECLKLFDLKDRLNIIKNIIFKYFQIEYDNSFHKLNPKVRFNCYNYFKFFNAFSDENEPDLAKSQMFQLLDFLCDECKKVYNYGIDQVMTLYDPEKIIKLFYNKGFNPKLIIEFLLNKDVLEKSIGLAHLADNLPERERKEIVEYIACLNINGRQMSTGEFYIAIGRLKEEEAKELYIKYCLAEKRFSYTYGIANVTPVDSKYSSLFYLNIIFEYLSPEELDSSFDEIKVAFSEAIYLPDEYDEKYNLIISTYAKKYNLNEHNLLLFVKRFSVRLLKYLDNAIIVKLINSNSEIIGRLFIILDSGKSGISDSTINDILNSLLQRQFIYEMSPTYHIFSTFERLLQNNDISGIKDLLNKISAEFNFSSILEKRNSSYEELYQKIIKGDLNLLHEITDNYIAHKRSQFVGANIKAAYKSLSMKKKVTRRYYKKNILLFVFDVGFFDKIGPITYTDEQKELIGNQTLLDDLLRFKRDPSYQLSNENRKYLRVLSELLDKAYDNEVLFEFYEPGVDKNAEYEYCQGEASPSVLINILLELNYDETVKILSSDNDFTLLLRFLEKYKLLTWEDGFTSIMEKCDLRFDEGTIASLISNFDKIKPYIEANETLPNIIEYANSFSMFSDFYKKLFGEEDYNLLVTNAGKNKATMSKYERLLGCSQMITQMYTRQKLTAPTFDEVFNLDNGKNIQIVLGNSTNMMNLTYGERTDACMRKGGAFDSLFSYCATNPNGFHVRFVNPETGQLISRVSGIRNGNTLFLNELRNSLDEEYTNDDLYEAIKLCAEHIIRITKCDLHPIDNVIITSDYALENHKSEEQDIHLSPEEKNKAFRNIQLNLVDRGILLASSGEKGELMPYAFGEIEPEYDSVRDQVKLYYGEQAIERIIQLRIINEIINGVPYENINTEFIGELPDYVISGEDYYISYKDNSFYTFILDSRKKNKRTLDELRNVLENGKNLVNQSFSDGSINPM